MVPNARACRLVHEPPRSRRSESGPQLPSPADSPTATLLFRAASASGWSVPVWCLLEKFWKCSDGGDSAAMQAEGDGVELAAEAGFDGCAALLPVAGCWSRGSG